MVRIQLIITLAFLACGVAFAADQRSPVGTPTLTDEGDKSVRVIPVPEESKWEHKTFSSDKKLFAIYFRDGWDEVISIHDASSGKQLRSITGHGDEVVEFKFSDDGKLLASRCINSGRAGWAIWDVATGKLLVRLPGIKASEPKGK